MKTLQTIRERLTLALLVVLPLHALLVTIGTKLLASSGHPPLEVLAIWKELLLILIVGIALLEIAGAKKWLNVITKWDALDWCIVLACIYGLFPSLAQTKISFQYLLGFKYDLFPLLAFFILRRVSWTESFQKSAAKTLVIMGGVVAAYGIATAFLPMSFFTSLGYSDLHSLYNADGPLAAFQQIGGTAIRRIQSTMSGPNQLGLWLLIPLGILMMKVMKKRVDSGEWVVGSMMVIALIMTFSRAAWIGAAVMGVVAIVSSKRFSRTQLAGGAVALVILAGFGFALFPSVLVRVQSSTGHIQRPLEALRMIVAHPFGQGLGTAGPASNAVSDTCVEQPKGADISWAKDRQDLCIFVEGAQVQPVGRACDCPVLTENWYLQWGVEMGWVGLILSVLIVVFALRLQPKNLGFLGVAVAGLFLHSFEDAAVAYTLWLLMSSAKD